MTYQGYMALADGEGDIIELVNAARVKAYTDNLAPTIGLRGCDDCDGLPEALGEEYTTPEADNAPWYDPTDAETADFYGVYPLGFEGIDDSTRTIESAELSGDGSVVVGSRYTGKDIRVSGMAFAKDEAALYAGMSWLDSALNGTEEGRCFGDRLNLYSSCPEIQVLPPNFAEPYTMDLGTVLRTNVITNPRATDAALWAAGAGTGGVTSETMLDGAGLILPSGDLINPYVRYTFTTASTGGAPYVGVRYISSSQGSAIPIGTQVAVTMYVRTSTSRTMHIRLVTTDGASFASNPGPNVAVPANTWTAISAVLTTTTATNYPQVRVTQSNADVWAVGQTFDATAAMAVIGATTVGSYFDGGLATTAQHTYGWADGFNESESYEYDAQSMNNEAAGWTTTSGTITPTGGGLDFDWDPGDPQKIACREITGLVPGEQYQLRMRLENFGDYYVRLGDSCANSRRNLAPNPRLLGWSWQSGGVADVESDVSTGGPLGLGYRQSIATSTNSSSPYSLVMPSDEYIPVSPGDIYQVSIYMMGFGSARLSVTFRTEAGGTVASDVRLQSNLSLNASWQRMSGIVVVPENSATMEVFVASSMGTGALPPNTEFGGANLLVEVPRYDVVRTNLSTDPRGTTGAMWAFFSGTGGATSASSVAGAVDGPVLYGTTTSPTYRRHTVTTQPTGGSAGPVARAESAADFPNLIQAGTPWRTGAFFRSSRAVSGTAFHRLLGPGNVVLEEFTQPFTLPANTWTYIAGGAVTSATWANAEEAYVWLVVGGVGGGATLEVGDNYDATGMLAQIGSTDTNYFDSLRPASGLSAYIPQDFVSGGVGAIQVLADPEGSYFDGFTDGSHWDGSANDSTSSSDLGTDYQIVSGWAGNPPAEPTVLDFIPRTDSIMLSITPTTLGDSVLLTTLLIQEASIRRTARPGVVAFGSGNEFVPPSDGWTHLAATGMRVTWAAGEATQWDSVMTFAQAPSGSALTYTTAHGPQRTIFGLIPGHRYRLVVEFDEGWNVTDSDPSVTVNPFVSLGSTSGAVATYTQNNSSTHYWVIEFTADATSSLLAFHPGADLALGSYGTVRWSFDQYMVEEILPTDATEPRPGRFQERTMYEVKASQGPVLTDVRTSPCGVMGRVTFALRAGNPFKYRSPIFAGGLPTGTSSLVPDIPCSEDGLAQIINFAYNPSLEEPPEVANTWLGGGVNLTFNGRAASPSARLGGYVYRITAGAAGELNVINNYYFPTAGSSGPTPQSGETLTVSGYVRATTSGTLGVFTMQTFVTMDGFPSFTLTDEVTATVVGRWYRLEVTFTLPDNVTLSGIETGFFAPPDVAAAVGMEVDALMIQRGEVATDPFDQLSPNVEWSGLPGQSALLLTPAAPDISEDPDCPSPPAPPAPPQIDDACVADPSAYNRTVVAISEDTVPRNLTAYPVITLTAGGAAVRQARIRFWANPDSLTIDEIYPCDYDGEIIVSYLAAGATMVIDGVLREATVTAPGFEPQNANHVLYGPDGGPVDWPELTGGIPYLVTLELDSGESYSDTIMLVDLVVKD